MQPDQLAERLESIVSKSLVQDLQNSAAFKVEVPRLALEATVLNRLAVLEALCASQAHTITQLQAEVVNLHSSLAANVEPKVKGNSSTQHSYSLQPDNTNSVGKHDEQQTAPSGRSPTMPLRSRVHTLNDPSTALQPLSREQFIAKLPKVVLKAGQIVPIQDCIRALLTEAGVTGNCSSAPDTDMQKLSAMIASVLLHNQDLIASFSPAHDKGSSSLAEHAAKNQNKQSVEQSVKSPPGHRHDNQVSDEHGETDVSNSQSTMLTGSIKGPEMFDQHTDDGGKGTCADCTYSSDGAAGPEEDVGCNSVINFFLAEMLGGSAE